ncbi:uncharacterized protein [Rutidosis leptorrhynchoides]|uniref:uncharacterized protein n=1 Tax=Rutidosis leptorrhynchoides TaxID=125765 RepID=UPI003A9987CD
MEDLNYPTLTEAHAISLEMAFDEKEIKDAVFDCGSNKAPVLTASICGEFSRGCNASFVALIPKKKDPSGLGDFRKSIDYLKSKKQRGIIFKVDFEKAFDCLNWKFLLDVMKCMGLGIKWRRWIHSCIKSASISIFVNGSLTNEFSLGRGIRQGDPLSPFLFILAAEGLNILTKAATERGLFKGVEIGNDKIKVSHLQYADDTIFLGEWSRANAYSLQNLLKCFELTSGLKVNFNKSCLYGVGVSDDEVKIVASRLGCQVGTFPFTYLGLPIDARMNKLKNWNPVVDKIKARLSNWKMKTLSFEGRLVLIKSILNSLPLYYFSLFRAPPSVLNILESVRRVFFWGGTDTGSKIPWVKGIKCIYGSCGGLGWDTEAIRSTNASIWKNILLAGNEIEEHGVNFKNSFVKKVCAESNTKFWTELWIDGSKLESRFPRLFRLEGNKTATILDRLDFSDGQANFKWESDRNPRGRTSSEMDELQALVACYDFDINNRRSYSWSWKLAGNGKFTVSHLTSTIDERLYSGTTNETMRNNLIPKKLEIFIWRANLKRLPVLTELDKRGIDVDSVCCPLCDDDIEYVEHSLISYFLQICFRSVGSCIFMVGAR